MRVTIVPLDFPVRVIKWLLFISCQTIVCLSDCLAFAEYVTFYSTYILKMSSSLPLLQRYSLWLLRFNHWYIPLFLSFFGPLQRLYSLNPKKFTLILQ